MNLYDVKKIPLSSVTDQFFTVMFYFKDGKRVLCNCPLSDARLKEWGVVLIFGSGSASRNGYKKLKSETNCLYSEDDAKREGTTFEELLQIMKAKVAARVESVKLDFDELREKLKQPRQDWYAKSQEF